MRDIVIPILAFCLMSSVAASQEKLDTRNHTLKNIRGCEVVIERLNEASAALGLTEPQLRLDVEQRLRAAGIGMGSQYSPMLAVTVTSLLDKSRTGIVFGYAAYVNVEFWQRTTIEANGLKDFAVTWKRGTIIGDENNAAGKEQIRSAVRNLVDRFISAILAANRQL